MANGQSSLKTLRHAPFTAGFMAICVLVFLVGFVSPMIQRRIFLSFSQINGLVAAGEWWRIFTAAFLHGGAVHIAFNMWALLQFGPPLERQLGSLAFGAMCLASAAWGGAAVYLLSGDRGIVVGASGALFGVFGVWLYASYLSRETPLGQAQFRSLMGMLAINAFIGFTVPRISWQGHAGGLAAGLLITAIWHRIAPATSRQRALAAAAVAVLAVVVVVLSAMRNEQ